jgi:predicted O-methyltransferase YrrM
MKGINRLHRFIIRNRVTGGIYRDYLAYKKNSCFPAGHFYSPIVLIDNVRQRQDKIWKNDGDGIEAIDLHTSEQIQLVSELSEHYKDLPFKPQKQNEFRYYLKNDYYSFTDGILLFTLIRHFKPGRIIEIGSGFSSALMLDVKELYKENDINLTFIEPYPERLFSLFQSGDRDKVRIFEKDVQDVDLKIFAELESGDILFTDSSHVAKTGSDLNFILFEILPKLKPGVLIHFHDIFYPFEYPKSWVIQGRNWNEAYFLRAFLMNNRDYELVLFTDYLHKYHADTFAQMPLIENNHGASLWLRKIK